MTPKRLKNKVRIVTGAAQGIGLATALKFAREAASPGDLRMSRRRGSTPPCAQCRELGAEPKATSST